MRLSYFQFLPLSDFLHLKSANIKIVSSIFSFINSELLNQAEYTTPSRKAPAKQKEQPTETDGSCPRVEDGPSGISLLKLLRVSEVLLLGRACSKPCQERVRQTGSYRLFFILLKVRTTQTAITTAATIKSISLWKYRLNNNKTKSMICKIGNNFLICFSSSNSDLLN